MCDQGQLGVRGFRLLTVRLSHRSAILSVQPPPHLSLEPLWKELNLAGVACAQPDGFLRLAPHWPNDLSQVPEFFSILDAIL